MENERAVAATLSPMEGELFVLLRRFQQREIDFLYCKLWPHMRCSGKTLRERQQRVGAVVSGVNKKIARFDLKILPGAKRGTYQLGRVLDRAVID